MNIFNKVRETVQEITTSKKSLVFAIKDIKGREFNQPFFQPTNAHALRVFKTEINRANEQNLLYLYPEDFELHCLGSFDHGTGEIALNTQLLAKGPALKT